MKYAISVMKNVLSKRKVINNIDVQVVE